MRVLSHYLKLTKPGILFGNVLTTVSGFALASSTGIEYLTFLMTLIGISSVVSSACIFNNYLDRDADAKMVRTQDRAFVTGAVSQQNALLLATALGVSGVFLLVFGVNPASGVAALVGFIVYIVYSALKYVMPSATLIGAIAGGIPPVVGYFAVRPQLDLAVILLFLITASWQMPHFYSIAIYRLRDYGAAAIPVLPVARGVWTTKVYSLFYLVSFLIFSFMLFLVGYVGLIYCIIVSLAGLFWLGLALQGFRCADDQQWARHMFICSLVMVTLQSIAIMIDS